MGAALETFARRWARLPVVGQSRPLHLFLALLLFAFFALFLIWPVLSVLSTGFHDSSGFTLDYLALVLRNPVVQRGLFNSLLIAITTTFLAVTISVPLAILSVRYEFRGRALVSGLMLLPMILPPFVGAMGMRFVLSRFGPLTELFEAGSGIGIDWLGSLRGLGVVLVEALALFPIVFLNVGAALANVDPTLERAAENLGASRWTVLLRITFPLVRPGLFAGSTLVLVWSFTELGTPLMFHLYDVTPVQIYNQIAEPDNPASSALVAVLLVSAALLYAVGKLGLGRGFAVSNVRVSAPAERKQLRGFRGVLALLPFLLVLLPAVVPHASVVLTSVSGVGAWHRSFLPREITFDHYVEALEDDLVATRFDAGVLELGALGNSMLYATLATLLAVFLAVAAGVVIVRSRVPGKSVLDVLSMAPLAVPGLVLAFGYLSVSAKLKQHFGADLPLFLDVQRWPVALLIVAYAARRLPYVVRSVVAGFEQTPVQLELAAANLGASPGRVLRRITVPLILANVLAGAIMAFTFALLEVSDSLILAQTTRFYPLTKAIWELSQRLGDGLYIASALGTWAMLVLAFSILASNRLLGKKLGAMFRA
jgi:iron(III) transport system permease protein